MKTHYNFLIFHSYVKLPEGKSPFLVAKHLHFSRHCRPAEPQKHRADQGGCGLLVQDQLHQTDASESATAVMGNWAGGSWQPAILV